MDEDKRYFAAADKDGDKFLTKEEFAAFQNPEGFDHMIPSLVETTLKEKDLDHDGYISMREFLMPSGFFMLILHMPGLCGWRPG